jgi:hypothetical protein
LDLLGALHLLHSLRLLGLCHPLVSIYRLDAPSVVGLPDALCLCDALVCRRRLRSDGLRRLIGALGLRDALVRRRRLSPSGLCNLVSALSLRDLLVGTGGVDRLNLRGVAGLAGFFHTLLRRSGVRAGRFASLR